MTGGKALVLLLLIHTLWGHSSPQQLRLEWLSSHRPTHRHRIIEQQHHLKHYLHKQSKNTLRPPEIDKIFRHPNRFLDKFALMTEKGGVDPDNLNGINLNVSTISELIWNLRGLRKRRRRSNTLYGNTTTTSQEAWRKLNVNNITWPLKKVSKIQGDIWLGGLMMVHEREESMICGPIMPQVTLHLSHLSDIHNSV